MKTKLTENQKEVIQRIGVICAFDGKSAAFEELDGYDSRTVKSLIDRKILVVRGRKAYINYAVFI